MIRISRVGLATLKSAELGAVTAIRRMLALSVLLCLAAAFAAGAQEQRATTFYRTIHEAAEAGDLTRVKQMIEQGANINAARQWRREITPLLLAIENDHEALIDFLISEGADVNKPSVGGRTPLHAAAVGGDTELCGKLLDAGANINKGKKSGIRPLHSAVQYHRGETIIFLLERGAPVNAVDLRARTPLHYALELKTTKIARLLIDRNANVTLLDQDGVSPFETACAKGFTELAKTMLAKIPKQLDEFRKEQIDKGFHQSFINNHLDTAGFLLAQGANHESVVDSPYALLSLASEAGYAEIVEGLIARGIDPNIRSESAGWTPLHFASLGDQTNIAGTLCSRGGDPNAKDGMDRTPLHIAAMEGGLDLVSTLLDAGADAQVRDLDGNTPLHIAAAAGRGEVARILTAAGSDTGARNDAGLTPSEVAMSQGHKRLAASLATEDLGREDAVGSEPLERLIGALSEGGARAQQIARRKELKRLLAQGQSLLRIVVKREDARATGLVLTEDPASVSQRDPFGYTALHLAADTGQADLVTLLIEHGASVDDAQNTAGWTPLHFSASAGHRAAAKALLDAGADAGAVDARGFTPLDVADFLGEVSVTELLREGVGAVE